MLQNALVNVSNERLELEFVENSKHELLVSHNTFSYELMVIALFLAGGQVLKITLKSSSSSNLNKFSNFDEFEGFSKFRGGHWFSSMCLSGKGIEHI